MMKLFRKSAMKKWGYFICSMIMLTFMLWGGQTYLLGDEEKINYAGKVFGRTVSFHEYDKSFKQVQIQAMMQYGRNFRKIQNMLNLDAQTWDRIILLQEAKKRRFQVSDEEVLAAIQDTFKAKITGPAEEKQYEIWLRDNFQIAPRTFEEGIRDTLKIAKLLETETGNLNVTDQEILQAYKDKNEKVQVSFVLFPSEDFKKQITVDETKVKDYFLTHQDEFVMPPAINIEYVQVDIPKTTATRDPKTDDREAAINSEDAARADAKETAQQTAQSLMEQMSSTKNFEQVAKDNNLSVQTSGTFSMEQPFLKPGWTFPLIQKLFQLKQGALVGPVQTENGFQILKIKEKKDAYIPDYGQAKEKIQQAWIGLEAKQLSRQKAEAAQKLLLSEFAKLKHPDFIQIAKGLNFPIQQTAPFGRGEYLPTIGISKDFQNAAFALTEQNPVSEAVETPHGYCFLHLDKVTSVDMKEFEKKKESFAEELVQEKQNAGIVNFLSRIRLKANLEDNMSKLRAKQKKQVEEN